MAVFFKQPDQKLLFFDPKERHVGENFHLSPILFFLVFVKRASFLFSMIIEEKGISLFVQGRDFFSSRSASHLW